MNRLVARPRSLLLVVALAVVAALCTAATANAASSANAAPHEPAAASTQCNFVESLQACKSDNPAVSYNDTVTGDTSHCAFVLYITWGDGSSATRTVTDPTPGHHLVAEHTYAAPGVYTITVSPQVTAGSCTATESVHTFTLIQKTVQQVKYYAALGDSYSAGLGTSPPYPGGLLDCGQSAKAYPALLDKDVPALGKLDFIACAGDVTDNFYTSGARLSQLASLALLSNTRLVTLTIGGNDIGFVPVVAACLNQKQACSKAQEGGVTARINALAGQGKATVPGTGQPIHAIAKLLADIHKKAPKARIFLLAYPRLFGTDPKYYPKQKYLHGAAPAQVCQLPSNGSLINPVYIRYDDAKWLDQTADRLNGVLAKAAAQSGVATFVSVRAAFTTHGDCDSGASWFTPLDGYIDLHGVHANNTDFHPTQDGQRAYERDLRASARL